MWQVWLGWNVILTVKFEVARVSQKDKEDHRQSPSSITRSWQRAECYSNMHSHQHTAQRSSGHSECLSNWIECKGVYIEIAKGSFSSQKGLLVGDFHFLPGLFYIFFRFSDTNIYYFHNHLLENQLYKNEDSWDPASKRINFYSEKYIKCKFYCDPYNLRFMKWSLA